MNTIYFNRLGKLFGIIIKKNTIIKNIYKILFTPTHKFTDSTTSTNQMVMIFNRLKLNVIYYFNLLKLNAKNLNVNNYVHFEYSDKLY